jgi:DNA replication protein DnaC
VFFARVWELREMIRSRIWFDDETTIADRVRSVDVLVLDDLRDEDTTVKFFTLSEIQELVRSRSSRHKITVITTRMYGDELQARVMRPFMEAAQGVLVPVMVLGPNLYAQRQNELHQAVFGE